MKIRRSMVLLVMQAPREQSLRGFFVSAGFLRQADKSGENAIRS
jgi:hypothetical protein